MTDLNRQIDAAHSKSRGGSGQDPGNLLRDLFLSVPGGMGNEMSRDMDSMGRIRAGTSADGKKPEEMTPQELHSVLWQVLTFRDSGMPRNYTSDVDNQCTECLLSYLVVKKIEKTIQKIPGLGPLIEKIMDTISG